MKVAIFAGGTGGHIFPGISIAEKFSKEEVIFFCSSRKLEKEIFSNNWIEEAENYLGSKPTVVAGRTLSAE